MKVLMFKPQFAEAVEAGTKRQTVRPTRKSPIMAGDELSLRKWIGLPYRSPQILLRISTCTSTQPFEITREGYVKVDSQMLITKELEEFAHADGFKNSDRLLIWFDETHGLPFRGTLIKW
jgi:hypothetical protein